MVGASKPFGFYGTGKKSRDSSKQVELNLQLLIIIVIFQFRNCPLVATLRLFFASAKNANKSQKRHLAGGDVEDEVDGDGDARDADEDAGDGLDDEDDVDDDGHLDNDSDDSQ